MHTSAAQLCLEWAGSYRIVRKNNNNNNNNNNTNNNKKKKQPKASGPATTHRAIRRNMPCPAVGDAAAPAALV